MPTPQAISASLRVAASFSEREISSCACVRQSHAALGRIHGLRNTQAEVPKAVAEAQGSVPVDGGRQPWIVVGEGIGHHMGGGEGDTIEIRRTSFLNGDRRA